MENFAEGINVLQRKRREKKAARSNKTPRQIDEKTGQLIKSSPAHVDGNRHTQQNSAEERREWH